MNNYIQEQHSHIDCAKMFACEVGIPEEIALIFTRRISSPKEDSSEYNNYYNSLFDSLEYLGQQQVALSEGKFLELKSKFEKQSEKNKRTKKDSQIDYIDKKRSSFMKFILFSALKIPSKLITLRKLNKIYPLNPIELELLYEWFCPFPWQHPMN